MYGKILPCTTCFLQALVEEFEQLVQELQEVLVCRVLPRGEQNLDEYLARLTSVINFAFPEKSSSVERENKEERDAINKSIR